MYWTVSYDDLFFSLSRLTQLQELTLDHNDDCREAFSVIGEMISLRKLSFDILTHVAALYVLLLYDVEKWVA